MRLIRLILAFLSFIWIKITEHFDYNRRKKYSMGFLRLVKGFILISWILALLSLAIYSGSGKASIAQLLNLFPDISSYWKGEVKQKRLVEKSSSKDQSDKKEASEEQNDPNIAIKKYISSKHYTDPIPIEAVLDRIFVEISWENLGKTYNLTNEDYIDIFSNIENEIKAISENTSLELEKHKMNLNNIINAFTKLPILPNPEGEEKSITNKENLEKIARLREEIIAYTNKDPESE